MFLIFTSFKIWPVFQPNLFSLISHTHNAVFADVHLADPSYSPSPCLCSKPFPFIRSATNQIFHVPAAVIVYIHLHKTLFAPALFAKP